jgi:hypothetical protein
MESKKVSTPVAYLRKADNGVLREHKRVVREIALLLKSLDKDLATLMSFNDTDSNMLMDFNDSKLDESQRMNAAQEAVKTWEEVLRLASEQTALTRSKD